MKPLVTNVFTIIYSKLDCFRWGNFAKTLADFSRGSNVHDASTVPVPMSFICGELSRLSKIEKVPRGIRGEKSSKDMARSRNLVSTIGVLASPKMGDGTRCPEG